MLCHGFETFSIEPLLSQGLICEVIELETPQIIYLVRCEACNATHSIEFSAIDGEPEVLARCRTCLVNDS